MEAGAQVFTDDHSSYRGLPNHRAVRHSIRQYVDGQAHTNGVESFWAMLKWGYHGVYHRLSPKHLQRYMNEFAGCHNTRSYDTISQMKWTAIGLLGRRLRYRDLVA
jgi:transposase-like protein